MGKETDESQLVGERKVMWGREREARAGRDIDDLRKERKEGENLDCSDTYKVLIGVSAVIVQ